MFIQTEETPNPSALKFIPDGNLVSPKQNHTFKSQKQAAAISPLAMQLFAISGVEAVFLGADFITITKKTDSDWKSLKVEIQASLMDFFLSKQPILFDEGLKKIEDTQLLQNSQDKKNEEDNSENSAIISQIKELIEIKVRPAVAMDGGDIVFHSFEDGIVRLSLRGSCSGCPSSTITLKNGIENMLRHYIPEVESVEQVENDDNF